MPEQHKPLNTEEIRQALGADIAIPVIDLPTKRPEIARALGQVSQLLPQVEGEK